MTQNKIQNMWGIKVRGKHDIFCVWDKSDRARDHIKKLNEMGVVAKAVRVKCIEVDSF
jgi:hypothetical protein